MTGGRGRAGRGGGQRVAWGTRAAAQLARDGRALFIADASNHRIRMIELDPEVPLEQAATVAAPVSGHGDRSAEVRVAGFDGLGGGGGVAAAALESLRFELAEAAFRQPPPPHVGDGRGAEAGPRVITIAGTGAKGGADGGTGYATLNDPVALAVDTTGDGTVYFVECGARRRDSRLASRAPL